MHVTVLGINGKRYTIQYSGCICFAWKQFTFKQKHMMISEKGYENKSRV